MRKYTGRKKEPLFPVFLNHVFQRGHYSHEPSIIPEPYWRLTKFVFFLPSRTRDVRKWTANKLSALRTLQIYICFHFVMMGDFIIHENNKQITWFLDRRIWISSVSTDA